MFLNFLNCFSLVRSALGTPVARRTYATSRAALDDIAPPLPQPAHKCIPARTDAGGAVLNGDIVSARGNNAIRPGEARCLARLRAPTGLRRHLVRRWSDDAIAAVAVQHRPVMPRVFITFLVIFPTLFRLHIFLLIWRETLDLLFAGVHHEIVLVFV